MVNGYVTLDLASKNIYKESLGAIKAEKPIMVVDLPDVYFADTIKATTIDDDVVIQITKGGKTITIANDNTITNVGDVLTIMENILDSQGNKRFIEGEITPEVISGVTFKYCRWSLSGTHLMIVVSGDIADTTAITSNVLWASISIPKYIYDKIAIVIGTRYVNIRNELLRADDWSTQENVIALVKENDVLKIINATNITLTADRHFRIQYDLLIDSDYSE